MSGRRQIRLAALAALAFGTVLAGCTPDIGDPCKRALDCGIRVIRQCDVSNAARDPNREGECTVENCSYGVCPKEAVCVKVYGSEFLSVSCDPDLEDVPDGSNDCEPHEVCLPEGLCASEIRAKNSCRLECDNDKDCRDNYQCVSTGVGGVYVAPDPKNPNVQHTAKICVPR
jgi:hypothetical protein